MNVDNERLAEKPCWGGCLVGTEEELVGVEVPVIDGDLPFVFPQIR